LILILILLLLLIILNRKILLLQLFGLDGHLDSMLSLDGLDLLLSSLQLLKLLSPPFLYSCHGSIKQESDGS
jgi:hypothetical protein